MKEHETLIKDLWDDYDTALDWGERKMAADIKAAITLIESLPSDVFKEAVPMV